ncbi:hypothetical protein RGQ29_021377 [Quercus rubra]|uniref:Uncharacterized protein n=1 Tax=Quercus rubra TaxID=3512 RepID=A0AAN7FIY1_QUERU|nr:hypothetical protein RGQ29_021377 [Quercus rubra]
MKNRSSTSDPLFLSRVLPLFPSLKKPQIASSPMSVNFTSSHQRPHLLTAEGFLRDQLVLILFKCGESEEH